MAAHQGSGALVARQRGAAAAVEQGARRSQVLDLLGRLETAHQVVQGVLADSVCCTGVGASREQLLRARRAEACVPRCRTRMGGWH